MNGFRIISDSSPAIRFSYYSTEAPATCRAFHDILPFSRIFLHARLSGEEIWTDEAPPLDIIQENSSVFVERGEAVFGPMKPERTRTARCIGLYYGEGKGLDCANIFAKVFPEDEAHLRQLGIAIWQSGAREIRFEAID